MALENNYNMVLFCRFIKMFTIYCELTSADISVI